MNKINSLLSEYGESHQNHTNKVIHKVFVPLIMWTVIGLFWAIPKPSFMETSVWLNFATIFVGGCLLYYISLSFKYFMAMIPVVGIMLYLQFLMWMNMSYMAFVITNIVVFAISWVFQFVGHKIEGKKPSFLKDLLFLLVGPLWVLKALFRFS